MCMKLWNDYAAIYKVIVSRLMWSGVVFSRAVQPNAQSATGNMTINAWGFKVSPVDSKWGHVSPSEAIWVQVNQSEIKQLLGNFQWDKVNRSESEWAQASPSSCKWLHLNPGGSRRVQAFPSASTRLQSTPNLSKSRASHLPPSITSIVFASTMRPT